MRECEITYVDRESNKMVTVKGLFHQWGTKVEGNGRNIVVRTVAIVENTETSEILMEVPNKLVFKDKASKANEFEAVKKQGIRIPEFMNYGSNNRIKRVFH